MKFSLHFAGGQQLGQTLMKVSDRVSRKVQMDALMAGAEPIREGMEIRAPRAPGAPDLADNMVISATRTDDAVSVAVGPKKGFFYGIFQEFGTVYHGAQPFARPAFDIEGPKSLPIIAGSLWRALIGRGFGSGRGSGGGVGV